MLDKLTDSEIIKALEEWIKELKDDYKRLQLLDAPMDCFEESHVDNIRVLSNALDLINRLQAKNERLKAKCENTQIGYNFAEDEIKKLKKDKYKLQKSLNQSEDYRVIAKAEAYKECIEKVKDTALVIKENVFQGCYVISKANLDNLLKELVGDT